MMKNIKEINKKKFVISIISGIIIVSLFSSTIYAYKNEFTTKIQEVIHYLAVNVIFKGEIEKEIEAYKNKKENELKSFIENLIDNTYNDLTKFKEDEIKRGKNAIDKEFQLNKNNIQNTVNKAVENEKQKQKEKTNEKIQTSKKDMDELIENVLNEMSNKYK